MQPQYQQQPQYQAQPQYQQYPTAPIPQPMGQPMGQPMVSQPMQQMQQPMMAQPMMVQPNAGVYVASTNPAGPVVIQQGVVSNAAEIHQLQIMMIVFIVLSFFFTPICCCIGLCVCANAKKYPQTRGLYTCLVVCTVLGAIVLFLLFFLIIGVLI